MYKTNCKSNRSLPVVFPADVVGEYNRGHGQEHLKGRQGMAGDGDGMIVMNFQGRRTRGCHWRADITRTCPLNLLLPPAAVLTANEATVPATNLRDDHTPWLEGGRHSVAGRGAWLQLAAPGGALRSMTVSTLPKPSSLAVPSTSSIVAFLRSQPLPGRSAKKASTTAAAACMKDRQKGNRHTAWQSIERSTLTVSAHNNSYGRSDQGGR